MRRRPGYRSILWPEKSTVACDASSTHFVGDDINLLQLHEKVQATVGVNMRQYGLYKYIALIRPEVLNYMRNRRRGWFYAVACDHPCGIKEGNACFFVRIVWMQD